MRCSPGNISSRDETAVFPLLNQCTITVCSTGVVVGIARVSVCSQECVASVARGVRPLPRVGLSVETVVITEHRLHHSPRGLQELGLVVF